MLIFHTSPPPAISHGPVDERCSQRQFHAFPGANYLLPSDDRERQRLTLQHRLLSGAFGGLLSSYISLHEHSKILESGAGTGIWSLELADQLPRTAEIQAIDIETRLFPTAHPQNVHFSKNSVTSLPDEWSNTFAIVHQRLLVYALRGSEWSVALREIFRVLAPGGYVQLIEACGDWVVGLATSRMNAIVTKLCESKGLILHLTSYLPHMLQDAGFVEVRLQKKRTLIGRLGGPGGQDGAYNVIEMFKGLKTQVLAANGFGLVNGEEEYDSLMDAIVKEWDETPGSYHEFSLICARKPLLYS